MNLGAFSVSLAVQDLEASRRFYQGLGFEDAGGNPDEGWLMLRNGEHVLGLFQGMFERNLLTFNPGWDQQGQDTDAFTDVRDIQRALRARGIEPIVTADEKSAGPAAIMVVDPDGNQILIDQHR